MTDQVPVVKRDSNISADYCKVPTTISEGDQKTVHPCNSQRLHGQLTPVNDSNCYPIYPRHYSGDPFPSGSSCQPVGLDPYLYFPGQPFIDHRSGYLDSKFGMSYPYVQMPLTVNQGLALTPHVLDGRYQWPPPGSPAFPYFGSPYPRRESATQFASRIHLEEQLQRLNYHTVNSMSRGLSPVSLQGLPFYGRNILNDISPSLASSSINLPGSLEGSRIASPYQSICGKSRKRAMSVSPISDYLDIQSLTRSSEASLQLTNFMQNSRSSSAASGSYGHLSVASFSNNPLQPIPPNTFLRPPSAIVGPPYFYPGIPTMFGPFNGNIPAVQHNDQSIGQAIPKPEAQPSPKVPESSSEVVSSTIDPCVKENRKLRNSKKSTALLPKDESQDCDEPVSSDPLIGQDGEAEFIETHCHWAGCDLDFQSQELLVNHLTQDHIQSNKRDFVCYWANCSREQKPFKAQYMLVVHMRRHTGEKPHKCTFEGCRKAYSRLENLKTHLRSHTGEKPYSCEFPNCSKAFSNASDRAKHQNRTHSNDKPYICKAAGCTKRYTDPSSLRKHVKTVHGPGFHANKKHKTVDDSCHRQGQMRDERDRSLDGQTTFANVNASPCNSNQHLQQSATEAVSPKESSESSPELQVIKMDIPVHSPNVRSSVKTHNLLDDNVAAENSQDCVGFMTSSQVTNRTSLNQRIKPSPVGSNVVPRPTFVPHPQHLRSTGRHVDKSPFTMDSGQKNFINKQFSPNLRCDRNLTTQLAGGRNVLTVEDEDRRGSNTSTNSSYMSSMRSDSSPYNYGSTYSSRRSSGWSAGDSRFSITNSPYEYDIAGNRVRGSRGSSDESGIMNVECQLRNAHLSQRNDKYGPLSPRNSGHSGNFQQRMSSYGGSVGRCSNYHDVMNQDLNDLRRVSDPVRTRDPDLGALKKLQRFNSLNTMQSHLQKTTSVSRTLVRSPSNDTIQSSRSSIATQFANNNDNTLSLPIIEPDILDDDVELIIPDDMQQFLNQCHQNNQIQENGIRVNQRSLHSKPLQRDMYDDAGSNSLDQSNPRQFRPVPHSQNMAHPLANNLNDMTARQNNSKPFHFNENTSAEQPLRLTQEALMRHQQNNQYNQVISGCYASPTGQWLMTNQSHPNAPINSGYHSHSLMNMHDKPNSPQVQVPHISQSASVECKKSANQITNPPIILDRNHKHADPNICYNQVTNPITGLNSKFSSSLQPICSKNSILDRNCICPQPPTPQIITRNPNDRFLNQPDRLYSGNMERSPGCDQVTSSTDMQSDATIGDFMDDIRSISTENLFNNFNFYQPTVLATPQTCDVPYHNLTNSESNLVVNDMSSILTQLVEENQLLGH